jgi:protein TonB
LRADSRTNRLEWGGALLFAALLHAGLVAGLPQDLHYGSQAGSRDGSGARIRLTLGRAAAPAESADAAGTATAAATPTLTLTPAPAPAPAPARKIAAEPIPPAETAAVSTAPEQIARVAAASDLQSLDGGSSEASSTAGFGGETSAGTEAGEQAGEQASGPESARGSSDARGFGPHAADYFDAVVAQMAASLDYPRRAQLESIEGRVLLDVRIDREGELEHCAVVESSGSRLLDRHALRVAKRAAPFGPVPASFEDADLSFELPVDFSLRDR